MEIEGGVIPGLLRTASGAETPEEITPSRLVWRRAAKVKWPDSILVKHGVGLFTISLTLASVLRRPEFSWLAPLFRIRGQRVLGIGGVEGRKQAELTPLHFPFRCRRAMRRI